MWFCTTYICQSSTPKKIYGNNSIWLLYKAMFFFVIFLQKKIICLNGLDTMINFKTQMILIYTIFIFIQNHETSFMFVVCMFGGYSMVFNFTCIIHTPQISGFCDSMKIPSELQKPYFIYRYESLQLFFPLFISCIFYVNI